MIGSAVTARSNVNVALVKYWGKRDPALNLPATGSISLTLDGLSVEARVSFGDGAGRRADDRRRAGERARAGAPGAIPRHRARRSGLRRAGAGRDPQPRAARRGAGVVGGRVRGARAGGQPGGRLATRRPGALRARAARLGLGGALDLRRLRRVAPRRARRRERLGRRAAPGGDRLGPARRGRHHAQRPEGGVVARRHGARRGLAALPGVGRRR